MSPLTFFALTVLVIVVVVTELLAGYCRRRHKAELRKHAEAMQAHEEAMREHREYLNTFKDWVKYRRFMNSTIGGIEP